MKVCCIQDERELRLAVAAGADAVGLVSRMPSGPGPIPEERIAALARGVPPGVSAFLLTCETGPDAIARQHARTGTDTLQLCDRTTLPARREVRARVPSARLVQVVHVTGPESLDEALAAQEAAGALLLDSGRLDGAVKELGGTGRTHDWATSRRICEQAGVPVFLAGGLTAANVRAAVDAVGPFGVDVCSGVRADGALDPARLDAFLAAVRG